MIKKSDFLETFNVKESTTDEMQGAVEDWYDLYYDTNTPDDEDGSQRLPVAVVSKIYKAVFSEYEASSDDEFAEEILELAARRRKKAMQQALIGGQSWLKPILGDKLDITVVTRDNVVILGRDQDGNVTDMGLAEQTEAQGYYYTLYERRHVEDGKLIIESRLFQSDKRDQRGSQVSLDTLDRYAGIEDETELPIDNIGMASVICPAENCVDGSDDPVSVYAAAVGLIHQINRNEAQLNTEFDNGQSRIIASADMIKGGNLSDSLFTALDDDPENVGITIFSPPFREQSYQSRKSEYLRNIESLIGLKRGILSEVEAVERTATEITSSQGDYNLTIIDFQEAWESAVRELVKLFAALSGAYRQGNHTVDDDKIIVNWGNGVLYDRDKTWAEYLGMVANGLLKPEIAVAWYFDLPKDTPADLEKVRADYMPQLVSMIENDNPIPS